MLRRGCRDDREPRCGTLWASPSKIGNRGRIGIVLPKVQRGGGRYFCALRGPRGVARRGCAGLWSWRDEFGAEAWWAAAQLGRVACASEADDFLAGHHPGRLRKMTAREATGISA